MLELKIENNNRKFKEERFGFYCINIDLNKWYDIVWIIKIEIFYKLL